MRFVLSRLGDRVFVKVIVHAVAVAGGDGDGDDDDGCELGVEKKTGWGDELVCRRC